VVRLQFQRLGIVGERGSEIAGLAQGEPKQIIDVGLLSIFGQVPQL
jgi:hypothetical protein